MTFAAECGVPDGLVLRLRRFDSDQWTSHEIADPFVLFGTDSQCNVHVSCDSVARVHAYLHVLNGSLFVADLTGHASVLIDNSPAAAEWVRLQSIVRVGNYEIQIAVPITGDPDVDSDRSIEDDSFDLDPPLTTALTPTKPCLPNEIVISMTTRAGQVRQVRSRRVVCLFGSADICKFRLRSTTVEPVHCAIVQTSGGIWLLDLLSRRGTHLNGAPVSSATHCPNEARLRVGRCRLDVDVFSSDEPRQSEPHASVEPGFQISRTDSAELRGYEPTPGGAVSEQLIRDLVSELIDSQSAAYEQAQSNLLDLLDSQERLFSDQVDSLRRQNDQLVDVVKMLTASRDAQNITINIPGLTSGVADAEVASEPQSDQAQPAQGDTVRNPEAPAEKPTIDPDTHNAWVRAQLHAVSEKLKEDREKGVKKLLRGLLPRKDDALR